MLNYNEVGRQVGRAIVAARAMQAMSETVVQMAVNLVAVDIVAQFPLQMTEGEAMVRLGRLANGKEYTDFLNVKGSPYDWGGREYVVPLATDVRPHRQRAGLDGYVSVHPFIDPWREAPDLSGTYAPGDVLPDGSIQCADGSRATTGRVYVTEAQGLKAAAHGWLMVDHAGSHMVVAR